MKAIFQEASMNVREFLSNDNEFNIFIPKNDQAAETRFKENLGVNWNQRKDVLQII